MGQGCLPLLSSQTVIDILHEDTETPEGPEWPKGSSSQHGEEAGPALYHTCEPLSPVPLTSDEGPKPGMVVNNCDPGIWKEEAGGSVRSHPWLPDDILGYV